MSDLPLRFLVLAWIAVLGLPFAALALSKLVKGPARRAAAALGPAATFVGLAVAALGLFASFIFPRYTLIHEWPALAVAALLGVLLLVVTPLVALRDAHRVDPFRIPGGTPAGVLLVIAAIAVPAVLVPALDRAGIRTRVLDLVGALPVLCMAFAIWTQARRDPPARNVEAPPPTDNAVPALDASAVWKRIGAVPLGASPFLGVPRIESNPAPPDLEKAWKAAGGVRSPLKALDHVTRLATTRNEGAFVADLPRDVEDALLAAALLHATAIEGATCLVVVDDVVKGQDGRASSAMRDRVLAGLRASGYWEPGPMPLGYDDLSVTLTGNRFPAIAFLDVDELSEQAIATLWGAGSANGKAWARHIELVVVPRIDHGSPLRVAHRFWSLRRLCLALRAAGASWSAVTTGYGADESYALAQGAFAGYIATERVEAGPRSRDETFVWSVDPAWAAQGPDVWQVRASEPIARENLTVAVDDPLGHVDDAAVRARGSGIRLTRALTFDGVASVAQLEGAWLFAAIRALSCRMPNRESSHHDVLLAAESSPTTRFALHPRTLPALLSQRRLPAPAPLVARRNPIVQSLHLRAALAEGEQDLASLLAVFDDRRMVEDACATSRRGAYTLRGATSRRDFDRVELVARSGERVPGHLRDTITEDVVRIVELDSGIEIGRTDAITLPTRYYPGRVFSKGARRYEVPLGPLPSANLLRVQQVDPKRPRNRPRLAIDLDSASIEHQADLELHLEGSHAPDTATRVRYATLRATVRESVHGVVDDDGRIVQRFAPLRSVYDTRVQVVGFRLGASSNVLLHLASAVDDVLRYTVASDREDFAVVPIDGHGFLSEPLSGIAVVDRQFQSAGVVEALPPARLLRVLEWVYAILAQCTCADGCPHCTSRRVLSAGSDKAGVLSLLGG